MAKLISLLPILFIIGCSTTGVDRTEQNTIVKEYFATVSSVTQVELSSEVQTGIATGAGIGLIDNLDGNREDMIAGTIAGGVIVGLFTALFEGDNTAYQYALNSSVEGKFTLVQKDKIDISSQCVKVRQAQKVSISSVPSEMCE